MSKCKPDMPKPEKLKYNTIVFGDGTPLLDKPRGKELYDYGMQTGLMSAEFGKTKDPTLGNEILQRMQYERDAWLGLTERDYVGAAKKSITIVSHLFQLGHDKHAIEAAKEEAERYIGLSPAASQELLRHVYNHNLLATSMLSCCAVCGKHTPLEQKRLFCGKCKVAVYCGQQCQKKHWDEGHRELCGKQAMCAACGKLLAQPMTCGTCKAVWYCDRAHQKWDWQRKGGHKEKCTPCKPLA